MPDFNDLLTEAYRVLDEANVLSDDAKRNQVHFVETELDLGMTFAESALASFSAGHLAKAKQSARYAKTAHRAAKRFLAKLQVQGKEREGIEVKLGKLTHLIEKLSAIDRGAASTVPPTPKSRCKDSPLAAAFLFMGRCR